MVDLNPNSHFVDGFFPAQEEMVFSALKRSIEPFSEAVDGSHPGISCQKTTDVVFSLSDKVRGPEINCQIIARGHNYGFFRRRGR